MLLLPEFETRQGGARACEAHSLTALLSSTTARPAADQSKNRKDYFMLTVSVLSEAPLALVEPERAMARTRGAGGGAVPIVLISSAGRARRKLRKSLEPGQTAGDSLSATPTNS